METREDLAKYFAELGFKVGAEIGVAQGYFSKVLLDANPGLKLYCVDSWKAYKGYRDITRQEKLDRFYEETKQLLSPYNVEIIRDWSMGAVERIPDNSLDFVYIDGNHDFRHIAEDICEWTNKVRIGGIVAGHDYTKQKTYTSCQVKDVVDAWGHAHKIKINITKDSPPSWWFMR